jgi:hypothetical protein
VHTPSQYTLVASLVQVDQTSLTTHPPTYTHTTVDTTNMTIGVRHIDWEAAGGGFALNGDPVHLRGFSHHQDFGGVGASVPDRVNLFRVNASDE